MWRNRRRELPQEDVDHLGVQQRREQSFRLARFRTDRADHPQILVLHLSHRRGTRTGRSPDTGQRPLLPEASFVLEEDAESLLGVLLLDFRELFGQLFFLNSSCRTGLAWG